MSRPIGGAAEAQYCGCGAITHGVVAVRKIFQQALNAFGIAALGKCIQRCLADDCVFVGERSLDERIFANRIRIH